MKRLSVAIALAVLCVVVFGLLGCGSAPEEEVTVVEGVELVFPGEWESRRIGYGELNTTFEYEYAGQNSPYVLKVMALMTMPEGATIDDVVAGSPDMLKDEKLEISMENTFVMGLEAKKEHISRLVADSETGLETKKIIERYNFFYEGNLYVAQAIYLEGEETQAGAKFQEMMDTLKVKGVEQPNTYKMSQGEQRYKGISFNPGEWFMMQEGAQNYYGSQEYGCIINVAAVEFEGDLGEAKDVVIDMVAGMYSKTEDKTDYNTTLERVVLNEGKTVNLQSGLAAVETDCSFKEKEELYAGGVTTVNEGDCLVDLLYFLHDGDLYLFSQRNFVGEGREWLDQIAGTIRASK